MALREMVEGDCGGTNPLVSLSSHFLQDRGLKDEGYQYSHGDSIATSSADQLVQDFLEETMGHSTQSFRMDSLLTEMRDLEGKVGPVRSAPVSELTQEEDVQAWALQYIHDGKHFETKDETDVWSARELEEAGNNAEHCELGLGPKWADNYIQRVELPSTHDDNNELSDLSNSEEYDGKEELKETAAQLLDSVKDHHFAFSKFMSFMKHISLDEIKIHHPTNMKEGVSEVEWVVEFADKQSQIINDSWLHDFNAEKAKAMEKEPPKDNMEGFNKQLWEKLTQHWENLESSEAADAWTSDFGDFSAAFKEYNFAKENPMTEIESPLIEGQQKLKAGDLVGAVLCFEAAVQQEPENPFAWQLLGTSQAENEKDPQAISALKKCVALEPGNLTALLALAVSYTNENYQNQACRALKEWLHVNPKYCDLVPAVTSNESASNILLGISSIMKKELHEEVTKLFLEAARRNPSYIDPDVQCCLGVLFNLSNETERAVDCLRASLRVKPEDSRLWNRLGAILANGGRSEEAVEAYRRALELCPGFIRARYNLGITCVHLGAYTEAAEHLLSALNQQASGRGPQGFSESMSDSIWQTLRLAVSLLQKPHLEPYLNARDLRKLNEEFGIE